MTKKARKPKVPTRPTDERLTAKVMLAKARAADGTVEESEALDTIDAIEAQFENLSAVVPRYDPESLLRYVEVTPHLRPCIDAMAHNIDGFGYHHTPSEPWMKDLDSEEATEAIRQAIEIEQWVSEQEEALEAEQAKADLMDELFDLQEKLDDAVEKERSERTIRKWERVVLEKQGELEALDKPDEPPPLPLLTPADEPAEPEVEEEEAVADPAVEEMREKIRLALRQEEYIFKAWFKNCCSDRSFVQLRRDVREDIKAHGWGGIEFLRDGYGRLKRLAYVPGYTVRPLVDRGDLVEVAEDDSVTPLSEGREVMVKRRFRVYVQIIGGAKVYFKSPGDPRVVSRLTGKVYKDERALRRPTDAEPAGEGPEAQMANELLYLADHDPSTPCPPPVWIGNLVSVLGVREADETNYFYLADKAIPAGLVFVHGGRVPKGTKQRLESRIKNELAGARGSGKLLVVEATPSGGSPSERAVMPSISFQSLRDAATSDALFANYDMRTADRIGASFRLSAMLRGYTPASLNRATAYAALEFAEEQVFQPEREEFDWFINRYVLPELNIRFTQFASNSPPTRSAEEVSRIIQSTAPHGAWTPNEAREAIGDVMNREMAKIDEDWANQPMVLTLAGGGSAGGEAPEEQLEGTELADVAMRLRKIEARVTDFVTEELRALGFDYEVRSSFVEPEDLEPTGTEEG